MNTDMSADEMMARYRSQLISDLRTYEGLRNYYQRRIDEVTETIARMDKKDTTP